MPILPSALGPLITQNVAANFTGLSGTNPLTQKSPAYFTEFCTSIAKGLATGIPTITFDTLDTGFRGVPAKPGIGTGSGIIVDLDDMDRAIYTEVRNQVIASYGETTHHVYPPGGTNSGVYLRAFSKGVAAALKTHFATAWTLASTHPQIYAGTGSLLGKIKNISATSIQAAILSQSPSLKGAFWPKMALAVGTGIKTSLETKATGTVTITGICAPSAKQLCAIPGSGLGSGIAT